MVFCNIFCKFNHQGLMLKYKGEEYVLKNVF